jgi:Fe-S oxidoreductase
MFQRERCDGCGDCLVDCPWMEVERGEAQAWIAAMLAGERSPVLAKCITCYGCNETCPRGANPFDLIAALQEKYEVFSSAEAAAAQEARYVFDQELRGYPAAARVMSTCVFGKTDAHLLEGSLYDLPRVGGKPYFCWVLFSHTGAESIQRKHAGELVARLAMTGAKEVVCFHDDCYAMLARLAPDYGIDVPFRPVHLAEHLVAALKADPQRVRPLGMKLAYQRPCASRFTPEKERFIDELFALAGARRVERAFDREHALCCAGIKMLLGQGDPRPDQEKNIRDAKAAGADAMVCLCPMCMHSLAGVAGELQMPLVFLGDIARMAIGEMAPPR